MHLFCIMLLNKYPRFTLIKYIVLIAVIISFITRIVLCLWDFKNASYSITNLLGAFGIGLFYDVLSTLFIVLPFTILIWFTNDVVYKRPLFYILAVVFTAIAISMWMGYIIPAALDKKLRQVVYTLFSLKVASFIIAGFVQPAVRKKYRNIVLQIILFAIIFLLLLNAISEIVFWNEFGVRYNFIAVDYLVYTTEVLGNIWESYPVGKMLLGVFVLTAVIYYFLRKPIKQSVYSQQPFLSRTVFGFGVLICTALHYFFVTNKVKNFSENNFANELSGNGLYCFGAAYISNDLDFNKFYETLPISEAYALVKKDMAAKNAKYSFGDSLTIERKITDSVPQNNYNVVLISVESLSADFMKKYGNTQNITPGMDSLLQHSLVFNNLYANGTRTVRGLEALSLSIPPVPGQSIVKRPPGTNENLFSLGSVLKSRGYQTQYIYGGYGYFDNMNYFFSNNAYDVIDRTALQDNEIHYSNIWGVADEDLFTLSIKTLDDNHKKGKPFFSHIMTVSNHRPFTYPDGRIDILSKTQSREGGVKYTDYAITRFINEAKTKPWFANTIFVVVADHCASSAGKVDLPVNRYHIPCFIFAPSIIKPQEYNNITAQIDIAPTILGLLHISYTSTFFGRDVLQIPVTTPHCFISNYQSLGFIQNQQLVIQKPLKQVQQFNVNFDNYEVKKTAATDSIKKLAIAYYQVACDMVAKKKNGALKQHE